MGEKMKKVMLLLVLVAVGAAVVRLIGEQTHGHHPDRNHVHRP